MFSTLPAPEVSGWLLQSDSNYAVDWESPEVQLNIRHNIEFLTKGCSWKKAAKHFNVVEENGHKTVGLDDCIRDALMLIQRNRRAYLMMIPAVVVMRLTINKLVSLSMMMVNNWRRKLCITDEFCFSTYDIV